jgi:hypothetical protein
MSKETVKAVRVTIIVDESSFESLADMESYESGNLFIWEATSDEFDYDIVTCDNCGEREIMETDACSPDLEYCIDCCECPVHHDWYDSDGNLLSKEDALEAWREEKQDE